MDFDGNKMMRLAFSAIVWVFLGSPMAISQQNGRLWPDGNGGTIRGDIVLSRSSEIVIRTDSVPNRYKSIPKSILRDSDKRNLRRLVRGSEIDELANLKDDMRVIANIHDAQSMLTASSLFREKNIAFVLSSFEEYLDLCKSNRKIDEGNLWALATIIFEHPQTLYPDFLARVETPVTPDWPTSGCYTIRIVDDIPYFINGKHARSGPCWPDARGLISWIRDHAQTRKTWKHPTKSPTLSLFELGDDAQDCRVQAWRLVSHLFDENWQLVFFQPIDDVRWERLVSIVDSLNLIWDIESRSFQIASDVKIPEAPQEWLPVTFLGHVR